MTAATRAYASYRLRAFSEDPQQVLRTQLGAKFRENRLTRELSAHIRDATQAAWRGEPTRMCVSAPPRHGKSATIGVAAPISMGASAWLRDEPWPVLYATSSRDRAVDVSRQVRAMVERIHRATGDDWWAPGEQWTQLEFSTRGGFTWRAIGWKAGSGGIGARCLVMDDLLGSSVAYQSDATLRRLHHVIAEDLMARLMGSGTVAIQMETRRGTRDATGHLTSEYPGTWRQLAWRCHDPESGYLWPEVYGEAWRAGMPHLTDSSPVWRSLYQQQPTPDGGMVVEREWVSARYAHAPQPPPLHLYDRIVIGVDLATTGSTRADDCAFVVVGCRGALRDVLHVTSAQMSYVAAREHLRDLCAEWRPWAVVVERAANGDALISELSAIIPGLRGESTGSRDKVARLMPWLPMLAAGQVRWPTSAAPWRSQAIDQLLGFTGERGAPDDIVDALVWALVAAGTERPSVEIPDDEVGAILGSIM